MRKICVTRNKNSNYSTFHCVDGALGYGSTCDFKKFFNIECGNEFMLIHAFCLKSIEIKKQEGCKYLSNMYHCEKYKYYLAPQAKINKTLILDNEAEKRKYLQCINEPYYKNVSDYNDEKILYASIAKQCNLDSIDFVNQSRILLCAICPACGETFCDIYVLKSRVS